MKIVKKIQLKIVIFTAVKNRCILHGHVFVMGKVAVKLTCSCCVFQPIILFSRCHGFSLLFFTLSVETQSILQLELKKKVLYII